MSAILTEPDNFKPKKVRPKAKPKEPDVRSNGGGPPEGNGHDERPVVLKPYLDALKRFAEVMFRNAKRDGYVSFRVFEDNGKSERAVLYPSYRLDDPEFDALMLIMAERAASWFRPAVFAPPVCTFKNEFNAKTDNIHEGVALSVECDAAPSAAQEKLGALLGETTITVESGGEWINEETGEVENKAHLHWRLREPARGVDELAQLYEARSLAAQLVGADPTAKSIVHPMRWPGSWHRKKQPRLARIAAISEDAEIDLAEALRRLREAAAAAGLAAVKTSGGVPGDRREVASASLLTHALSAIPNDNTTRGANGALVHDWEYWNKVGMTIWASTGGSEEGRLAFHEWSAKSPRNDKDATEKRWQHYFRSPPSRLGFGSLVWRAREADPNWQYGAGPGFSDETREFLAQLMRDHDEERTFDGEAAEGAPPPEELASGPIPTPQPNAGDEIPAHLLEVPGLVGRIAEFITDSGVQSQPLLALGAALVLVGTAAGRLFAGPTLSGTHLYVVGLAESGTGKDHPLSMVVTILKAANLDHVGPSQFISMPAAINFLLRMPLSACAMDEFGSFLRRINHRKAGEFTMSISGILRMAWGSSFKSMVTPEWAGRASVTIEAPAMSIFGVSTPDEYFAALEGTDVINGALNRFILLTTDTVPARRKPVLARDAVPQDIIDALRSIYNHTPKGALLHSRAPVAGGAKVMPMYEQLSWGDGAEQVMEEMADKVGEQERADKKLRPFLARVVENAVRLATIRAIGCGRRVVEEADMAWARDFMWWSAGRMAEGAGLYIADSETQSIANAIKRVLKGNGKVARSALINALDHKYRASDLNGTMSLLVQGGNVEMEEVPQPPGKTGRPGIWYTFRG